MAIPEDFRHTIVLPVIEMIDQPLAAFLETSEHGTWSVDDSKESTTFHLFLIRGNWRRSFFGLGSKRLPDECDRDSQWRFIPETKPMLLEVTIRPSLEDVRIGLRHSVFSKYEVPSRDLKDYRAYWSYWVHREVKALRDYLGKCYHLDLLPRIETVGR
jgi:hypothetical protein